MWRNMADVNHTYRINVVDNNHLTATCIAPIESVPANYFSAILSADREIVYWVNDSRPLP